MASRLRKHSTVITVFLGLTAFSCSLPFFGKNEEGRGERGSSLPARLTGVLELNSGCSGGYYQIRLVGLNDETQNQVESQSDQNGRFSIVAPSGSYQIQVAKGECGVKQTIHLEGNTEHMISLPVAETRALEKAENSQGRLPASILIEPKR
jgi:hypothetical protein